MIQARRASTIGLQGCRTRISGEVIAAAHVAVEGATGSHAGVSPRR